MTSNRKVKNVFIFGAGASADAGAPLMGNFFDKAKNIYRLRNNDDIIKKSSIDFERVFDALSDLQGIYAKSFLDLDNIETLFGAFEMGKIIGRLSKYNVDEIDELRKSIITVIVKTIEFSITYEVINNIARSPLPYDSFFSLIKKYLNDDYNKQHFDFSFITFNYDLALDVGLSSNDIKFNYFLEDDSNDCFPLLKLHGSINWAKERNSNKITFWDVREVDYRSWAKPKSVHYNIGSLISANQNKYDGLPLIVPPTWNKTEYQQNLRRVWQKAAEELSLAENLFIIGYSLPETDMFFRYLYSLGSLSATQINKIVIINPDKKIEDRFRNMIALNITNRRFTYIDRTFTESMNYIEQELLRVIK